MIHVLGMSIHQYQNFVDENEKTLPIDKILKEVVIRGEKTSIVVLPKVVDWARKHFNCPELEGVELENQGPQGSRGSHWERRAFFNEIMTSSLFPRSVLSGVTLALLESTGWYKIDHSVAQILKFGMGKTCKFLDTPCIDKSGRPLLEGYEAHGKGKCLMVQSPETIPKHFDYLETGFSAIDPFSDNCPFATQPSKRLCSDIESVKEEDKELYGEEIGVGSRCFEGDYYKKAVKLHKARKHHTGCHKFRCDKNEAGRVFLNIFVEKSTILCPPEGGKIMIPGYIGKIECPAGALFCAVEQINECASLNFCSGVGKCWAGRCLCPNGTNQRDCSIIKRETK
eukprot:TRINITY_DN17391_c0_g1_i1.p1 TRINITY_DN17391_c0_g1~~TRINITY_DN17391_c0_g1_i1.p1  ORF type:complete len:340 (-),score=50.93 TRINITY_DN17391_c0_g1_i1:7-1026(-)